MHGAVKSRRADALPEPDRGDDRAGARAGFQPALSRGGQADRAARRALSRRNGATPHFVAAASVRVWRSIAFTSQVLPPSAEKACSDWTVSAPVLQIDSRASVA